MISLFAKKIIDIGQRLYARGLIAGSDGNISARLDNSRIIITASGKCKGFIDNSDMTVVDMAGEQLSGSKRASSETAMHLHLYRNRPDIFACVHAHPPYATAFAVAGRALDKTVLPEVELFVGNVPLTEYAPPGTEAVGKSLDPYLKDHDAFLLKNHGLVAIGRNLEEAYNRLETIEHFARILFLAQQLGQVDKLDDTEIERLKKLSAGIKKVPSHPGP